MNIPADPLAAIREAQVALRVIAALAAAEADTSPELHPAVIEVLVSAANTAAVLERSTPRQVLEDAGDVAPDDETWTSITLRNAREWGRRMLGQDAGADAG